MRLVQIGISTFDPNLGPPCHDCTARCCKYFALEIDAPVTPEDHDFLRWYLMHEHVVVWKMDKAWYLEIRTRCQNLQADNSCGIYHSRPQICRDYGWPDKDKPDEPACDYFSDEEGYDLFFDTPEKFEAWSRVALAKREVRLARRRKAARTAARRQAAR